MDGCLPVDGSTGVIVRPLSMHSKA